MDVLIATGLAMTAAMVACSLVAYRRLVVAVCETEQQVYDRRFAEIVARFGE